MRFYAGLTVMHRIRYRDKLYEIIGISDEDTAHRWTVANCKELVGDGLQRKTAESESENGAVQSEEEEQSTEDLAEESDTYSEEQNNIHYIYIESPYLETPGTQRIVFSFENAFADYEGISITVMNSEGAQED